MSLVLERQVQGPALHALVVGVGHYPNMARADLASAARSALAFADWLADDFSHPDVQLGSIELLVSIANGNADWRGSRIDRAMIANFVRAVGGPDQPGGWFKRCAKSEENIALLFFCGHGIEKGLLRSAALFQEYDHSLAEPASEALEIDEFKGGMESCLARRQLFIFDACRETPDWLVNHEGPIGRAVVARKLDQRPTARPRQLAILKSTSAEQRAWGDPAGLSRFTLGLLKALKGPAADDSVSANGDFEVRPERIPLTLLRLAGEGVLPWTWGHEEPRLAGGDCSSFVFHVPKDPRVPVRVGCVPIEENSTASMSIASGPHVVKRGPAPEDWFVELQPADVTVKADFPNAPSRTKAARVRPPVTVVKLT